MRRALLLTHRIERWTRTRFTPMGRLLLGALVAVGLFSLNPRASSAYQLSVLIIAILVCAMLWAPVFRPKLRVARQLPRFASVGAPLRYHVLVHNQGRRAIRGCSVSEWQPLTLRDAPSRYRDGYIGFLRALTRRRGYLTEASAAPGCAPGEQLRIPMTLTPVRRGYLTLSHVLVSRPDPLGIFNAIARYRRHERVLCLPERFAVSLSTGHGRARDGAAGTAISDATGAGIDFARLREYRQGDPLRHIDWRAWARFGEPVVKEFHEEAPSRNALILDTALPRAGDAELFETAVSVAASFAGNPSWCTGRLDLLFAGEELLQAERGRAREGMVRMLEALALVEPTGSDRFVHMSSLVQRALGRFSNCVCVLLALDGPRQALLEVLRASGSELTVLVVHAPGAPPTIGDALGTTVAIPVPVDRVRQVLAGLDARTRDAQVAAHG